MPVILAEVDHETWLSGEAGKRGLGPVSGRPDESVAHRPSKKNDADIIAPIELNTGRDLVSDPRVRTLP
jgi:hypothetical protein